jgi:hypothetical protein
VPAYDFLKAPDDRRRATKVYRDCNYLQGNEGNIDSIHVSFLHAQRPRWNAHPGYDEMEGEPMNFGIRNFWIRYLGDRFFSHINNFIMPNMGAFPSGLAPNGYGVNWHVPIDDTHHWEYVVNFRYEIPSSGPLFRPEPEGELQPDYHLVRNRVNRYLQDREEMQTRTFIGTGSYFYVHDGLATEGAGPIQDRSQEHLGAGDRAIVAERMMLLQAIADIQAGRDPLGVVRDPKDNHFEIVVRADDIPASWDWRTYWKAPREEEDPASR